MYEFYCIGFIEGKMLLDFTNLFSAEDLNNKYKYFKD